MTKDKDFLVDKAGKKIEVGDYIIYGHSLGRCVGLRFGKVLSLTKGSDFYGMNSIKMKIIGVDDDYDREARLLSKPSHLQFGSRTVSFKDPSGIIPSNVIKLLNNYAPTSTIKH